MTLSRHRPSSTRNRPCCGERNTYLVWPRDDLLPVRWGFFESPPSLASLESFYSVRLSLLQINYMSSYNNGLLCGVGIRAWRAGPDRNRDVSLTHGPRSMSHVVTSPPGAQQPRKRTNTTAACNALSLKGGWEDTKTKEAATGRATTRRASLCLSTVHRVGTHK